MTVSNIPAIIINRNLAEADPFISGL